jgi:hypothetical protein
MKKINGQVITERDHVGEIMSMDTRLIKSACNLFFTKRGLPTNEYGGFGNAIRNDCKRRKRTKKS